MAKLRQHGCTIDNILHTTDEELGKLIYPVGFWKVGIMYIMGYLCSKICFIHLPVHYYTDLLIVRTFKWNKQDIPIMYIEGKDCGHVTGVMHML